MKYLRKISDDEFSDFMDILGKNEAAIRGFSDELYSPSPKNNQYDVLGIY